VFTGLIEEIGRVRRLERYGQMQRMEIEAGQIPTDLQIGDSVSIAGACQTAVGVHADGFVVESVPETLSRTTLGALRVGDRVNLERALRADSRLGGHFVLGHVDDMGQIQSLVRRQDSWDLMIEAPGELMRLVAAKGSIAIDGISLTVVAVAERGFTVAIIPHTFENTTLAERRQRDHVNLEVDVIARYLERLHGSGDASGLTWESLRQQGY
jgi:riboflavin synthase